MEEIKKLLIAFIFVILCLAIMVGISILLIYVLKLANYGFFLIFSLILSIITVGLLLLNE